jgi:hypothetical protein
LIVGSMGSIFAEKALYGSDVVTPGLAKSGTAKSGRALGSAFRGMPTAFCDFIFGTVCSSAVQDRSTNKRPPQSPSSSPQSIPSHCMAPRPYTNAGPSVLPNVRSWREL